MGSRLLDAGVALAAIVSAALLALMLGAPLLPQVTGDRVSLPSGSVAPSPSLSPDLPPLGLYLLRGPFTFGPCLAMELEPRSYPIGADAGVGEASVLWWERGMTGCDTRSGELESLPATVERVARPGDPGDTLGYAIAFVLPASAGVATEIELTILAARSTQALLQVVDATSSGAPGMVFDRVPVVDPPLDPLPSPTPVAALQPSGLYLLQGPFGADGPCLVVELGEPSYPSDPDLDGAARIRWWDGAAPGPDVPECLGRSGEIGEDVATVIVSQRDETEAPLAYTVWFTLPATAPGGPQDAGIMILLESSTRDQLVATLGSGQGGADLIFDRVDSIDPPLVTPSPPAGG